MQEHEPDFQVDDSFWNDLPDEGLRTGFEARIRHWTEACRGPPYLPLSWEQFDALYPLLQQAMRELFGPRFTDFRGPEQARVIQAMLAGRDVRVRCPRGPENRSVSSSQPDRPRIDP